MTGRDSSLYTLSSVSITRHVSIEGNLPIVYYIYTSQIIPSFPYARDRDDAMAMGEEEETWGGAREGDEDGRRTRDGRRLGVE